MKGNKAHSMTVEKVTKTEYVFPSEFMDALKKVDGLIWIEAFYDPTNESTQKFARELSPYMKTLNGILGFKK